MAAACDGAECLVNIADIRRHASQQAHGTSAGFTAGSCPTSSAVSSRDRKEAELRRELEEWKARRAAARCSTRPTDKRRRPHPTPCMTPVPCRLLGAEGVSPNALFEAASTRLPNVVECSPTPAVSSSQLLSQQAAARRGQQHELLPEQQRRERQQCHELEEEEEREVKQEHLQQESCSVYVERGFHAAWLESVQAPRAPPPSPLRRTSLAMKNGQSLSEALAAALTALIDTSPRREADFNEEPMLASPLQLDSDGETAAVQARCDHVGGEPTADKSAAVASTTGSSQVCDSICGPSAPSHPSEPRQCLLDRLEAAAKSNADAVEASPAVSSDAAVQADLRQRLREHVIWWDEPTVLCTEDFLSRAFDRGLFSFFEARDRARSRLPDFVASPPPDPISEYPSGWPRWKVYSYELREAARAGRRRTQGATEPPDEQPPRPGSAAAVFAPRSRGTPKAAAATAGTASAASRGVCAVEDRQRRSHCGGA